MSAERKDAAPRPEARTGEARRNGPQPLTLDERRKIGEHLLSLLILDAKFDRQRDLIVTWFRRYEATVATVKRERDEARRARDVADHDLRCIIAALSPSELVRLSRLLQEEVAALAARPAETPEGR